MKLNFLKQILSVAVLTVAFSGFANAQSGTIDFTLDDPNTTTGSLLTDLGTDVVGETVATGIEGLNITVDSITTSAATNIFVAVDSRAGVGDNFFRAGATNDSITFSFDQDVEITELEFASLTGNDAINVNGTPFTNPSNAGAVFAQDPPISLAAGESLTFTASSGNVGLLNIDVTVASAVPEPSSAALLGLLSLGVVARRRRR